MEYYKEGKGIIQLGDCLDLMQNIPDGSIDMILADLPYGTTTCKWDSIIDLDLLWIQYKRIIKDNGAIVLFCQQPFTSLLISSNIKDFKYMWYWKKARPSGFTNAKLKPLKDIEEISVFSKGKTANGSKNNMIYNPQDLIDCKKTYKRLKSNVTYNGVSPTRENSHKERIIKKEGYPRQILEYSMHNIGLLHPTQKPTELFEYLIKTYTNEGDIVLDNVAGSGTTGEACENTNRFYLLMEKKEKYFEIMKNRLNFN